MREGDRLLRATFWLDRKVKLLTPQSKLALIWLISLADRDGICAIEDNQLGQQNELNEKILSELQDIGHICLYDADDAKWCWIPRVASEQPRSGANKVERCFDRVPPSKPLVFKTLEKLRGKTPTTSECKAASPRSYGIKREAQASNDENILLVWNAWKNRQRRPASCHLGAGSKKIIVGALKEAEAKDMVSLIAYAYEADEAGPRYWRGENQQGRTYLGLDNLLRVTKLASRLQMVVAWVESNESRGTTTGRGIQTDLGPMAKYRKGPRGTTTSPSPRPKRLSKQCRTMLQLFQTRGQTGVRTKELANIALKYSARVSELRGAGHDIYVAIRNDNGDNTYVLRKEQQIG